MSSSSSSQPTLARRLWPAVALAGASAAFLTALDKPAGFSVDEVALTGAQDPAVAVTVVGLPTTTALTPATTVVPAPLSTTVGVTVPAATVPAANGSAAIVPAAPVPVATVLAPPTTVAVALAPVDPTACTAAAIVGPSVNTRWGPVQVQAVLRADGTVCEVTALATPNSHRKSVQINDRAKPILHDRVIAAGGTQFQSVSGATITSKGYRASLQSIIDNA